MEKLLDMDLGNKFLNIIPTTKAAKENKKEKKRKKEKEIKYKGNLWDGRKCYQSIYMIRGLSPKYIKNSHALIAKNLNKNKKVIE